MNVLEFWFVIFFGIQILHSLEELLTGFHKKFPPLRMTFRFFLGFEIVFTLFWIPVFAMEFFPARSALLAFFPLLMFANGLWHIVWFWFFEKAKRYVPGLITAPVHVAAFFILYYTVIYRILR